MSRFAKRRTKSPEIGRFTLIGIEQREVRKPSLCDSFYSEEHECVAVTTLSRNSVSFQDPIYMLFNQERLAKLGFESVQKWLEQFKQTNNSELQQMLSKCSDEDIMAMVKPKNLQSPSELHTWLRYMNEKHEVFNSEMKLILEERSEAERMAQQEAAQMAQQVTPSEPTSVK